MSKRILCPSPFIHLTSFSFRKCDQWQHSDHSRVLIMQKTFLFLLVVWSLISKSYFSISVAEITGMGRSIPTPFFFSPISAFPDDFWVTSRGLSKTVWVERHCQHHLCAAKSWGPSLCITHHRSAWRRDPPLTSISEERRAVWSLGWKSVLHFSLAWLVHSR